MDYHTRGYMVVQLLTTREREYYLLSKYLEREREGETAGAGFVNGGRG
jgi:hypothetical protein